MEYLYLKDTDIRVSRLCVGGCPMGGYGWGSVSQRELYETVHIALSQGLNFFDTADIYGMGEAERILGDALQGYRSEAIINTKVGVRRSSAGKTYYDNSSDWIETAVEASLKRLRTDYIDVCQIHYRDGKTPLSDVVETLEGIKEQGKIRSYGLSNISYEDRDELKSMGKLFGSFQNEYSLANRSLEKDIIALGNDFSMTPMTWGSLGQGVLTGKYDLDTHFDKDDRRSREIYENFHGKRLIYNLRIVDKLREISKEHSVSVSSVAIRWILDRIPGSVVIAGVKRPEQLQGNLNAMGWKLSKLEMNSLDYVSGQLTMEVL